METRVIASGNLATPRRTLAGVLGQIYLLDLNEKQAKGLLTGAGLPARSLDEPDFPVSIERELSLYLGLIQHLQGEWSPSTYLFGVAHHMELEHFGVLGTAMRHADNIVEALRLALSYPQLSWGHCRLVVRAARQELAYACTMERPDMPDTSTGAIDLLVEYCTVLEVVSIMQITEATTRGQFQPIRVTLPFSRPEDWHRVASLVPCPVEFDASEACIYYPGPLQHWPLPRSNKLIFRSFEAIVDKLSKMLAEEISLTERVSRWLWAQTPPLTRGEIAQQLNMSERSLTRHLGAEGSSYSALLSGVQQERAKNFLRNPNLSITAIALRIGYSDPAAFSRAFSKWTGTSPLRWRQLALDQAPRTRSTESAT
jgi:AraC-like DNA-binding protein